MAGQATGLLDDMTAGQMVLQIALGSLLMLITILVAGVTLWFIEAGLRRSHDWLMREPHGPKMFVLLICAAIWLMGLVTFGVWLWALTFRLLGTFHTMESAVYFSLVSFTTLGYGDVLLPPNWRLLGGMAAANGFLTFGLLIAMLVEALRHVRLGQVERLRRK